MNRMTLEEKIGQMTQIERVNASYGVMNKYFIGSVLSGGGSVLKKAATREEWINVVNDIRGSFIHQAGNSHDLWD
ncbi:hypothetical protein K1719_038944 [Acacia pycnantha]|nr:hypothetical protein K1719_038944 [Acacia pycnantha]